MLAAREITKSFGGVPVLRGVDLTLNAGEVLALLGENGAGKSTLVKIISGEYEMDSGSIELDGQLVQRLTPSLAKRQGISVIAQELRDAGDLTVAENIFLGRPPKRRGLVSWSLMRKRAQAILDRLEIDIPVRALASSLSVGQRQIVEIARALTLDARILILDEPSAALSQQEVDVLFTWVRRLKTQGVAILYITHRLDEVAALADRVQVLRDGVTVLASPIAGAGRSQIIAAMVGRELEELPRRESQRLDPKAVATIELDNVTVHRGFERVSLSVHRGQITCLYGRLGSGVEEVAQACFGLAQPQAGVISVNGTPVRLRGPRSAIGHGIAMLPADRKAAAAFLNRSARENLAVASWRSMAVGGLFLGRRVETRAYDKWRGLLSIKGGGGSEQTMSTLSGGNQQKVLLARWLERETAALILVEPTRGVDVGARLDIYRTIRRLADAGMAVLVASSDYEEVIQIADSATVMVEGRVKVTLSQHEINEQRLLQEAGGVQ